MVADRKNVPSRIRLLQQLALGSYLALIGLTLAWEGWLAPKGPPGLWLILKSLPLLFPLFGLLRGRLRSYVYASLLLLLYLTEGLVIAWTEVASVTTSGLLLSCAGLEVALASIFFGCATYYVRMRRAEGAALV